MIHLMLNDLRCPAGVGLDAGLQFQSLIFNLDGFISFTRARVAKERQAAFLGIVHTVFFDNLGVEHHRICRSSSTLVEERYDTLANTDHIRRHTDTAFPVRHQRIKQILCN